MRWVGWVSLTNNHTYLCMTRLATYVCTFPIQFRLYLFQLLLLRTPPSIRGSQVWSIHRQQMDVSHFKWIPFYAKGLPWNKKIDKKDFYFFSMTRRIADMPYFFMDRPQPLFHSFCKINHKSDFDFNRIRTRIDVVEGTYTWPLALVYLILHIASWFKYFG